MEICSHAAKNIVVYNSDVYIVQQLQVDNEIFYNFVSKRMAVLYAFLHISAMQHKPYDLRLQGETSTLLHFTSYIR